jgi:hypothetical protein
VLLERSPDSIRGILEPQLVDCNSWNVSNGWNRVSLGRFERFASSSRLLRVANVDQHAVRVGHVKLSERAFGEKLEPRLAFRSRFRSDRIGREGGPARENETHHSHALLGSPAG